MVNAISKRDFTSQWLATHQQPGVLASLAELLQHVEPPLTIMGQKFKLAQKTSEIFCSTHIFTAYFILLIISKLLIDNQTRHSLTRPDAH